MMHHYIVNDLVYEDFIILSMYMNCWLQIRTVTVINTVCLIYDSEEELSCRSDIESTNHMCDTDTCCFEHSEYITVSDINSLPQTLAAKNTFSQIPHFT